jgi:hypothetical protein
VAYEVSCDVKRLVKTACAFDVARTTQTFGFQETNWSK